VTLVERLGLGDRELVSLVGGGGKSTLLFGLGEELAGARRRVVLTTTTKMGRFQVIDSPNFCESLAEVGDALGKPGPVVLMTGGDNHKVTGPAPDDVDELFRRPDVDFVIVEADGAHGKPLKAPAGHEPVVAGLTTTLVIAMGIDAVGRRLDDAAHRVEQAMHFSGRPADHVLTPEDCARIIAHESGALRVTPAGARVVVALTKVRNEGEQAAVERIRNALEGNSSVDDVVAIPNEATRL
jgi:probable selenium-dependent hydroxylase accessory protein YqeC